MAIILMLLPALAWGILPLAVARINGKPVNQIFGTAVGTLLVSFVVYAVLRPTISLPSFILAALAGGFWIIGQLGQYNAYRSIGVSQTMPISTGLQLIGTSLIGVLIFGEWASINARLFGALGIVLLIVGVSLTAVHDKGSKTSSQKSQTSTLIMLILTTIGFLIYNAIPRAMTASGLAIFLPESIGMVIAVLLYILFTRQPEVLRAQASWQSLLAGIIFSVAAITYILSVRDNGVNSAFVVSQLSVVLSTIGGMLFLHEKKSRRELILTMVGLVLIVIGAVTTTIF
ncbi:GRP family sugar transporter [Lactiplantibacillus pentosus]|uniref:Sugar transporter n=2 Tax=Lactiplantibacillus pentosus TaxID=1589 RepID=A0ABD7IS37_LACPE|nr:GRP family sugar transporter [Lactiplantibacillus pentosus]MCA1344068.1 sugar transporter [Lactiplantibacillus pentosus]MCJ8185980.1 GRP family sugar transporter [Lactiplantibacillus pentosus]MCT3303977.1 sugar transporter [Lactiplantibacillus pentosus]MCT3310248.1 sugar transporter [Lactiplantibacillus pentosus]PRO77958.1 sugar transporter [Lactiplantibacillus pentosus]